MIQIIPTSRKRSMAELLAGQNEVFQGELVDFGPEVGDEAVF